MPLGVNRDPCHQHVTVARRVMTLSSFVCLPGLRVLLWAIVLLSLCHSAFLVRGLEFDPVPKTISYSEYCVLG